MAPANLITVSETVEVLVNADAWKDIEFEVALDSGSVVHVCSIDDCPGYRVGESPGSRHAPGAPSQQISRGGCLKVRTQVSGPRLDAGAPEGAVPHGTFPQRVKLLRYDDGLD